MKNPGWRIRPNAAWLAGFLLVSAALAQDKKAENDGSDNVLFLTGRAARSDSLPLERPVRLALVCGGRVLQQTYTAENGSFSFSLEPGATSEWMDASVGNDGSLNQNSHWNSSMDKSGVFAGSRFRTFNLSGCRIELGAHQGFVATAVELGSRSAFDNPDVGTMVLSPSPSAEGQTVSLTTLSAPPDAVKAFRKAAEELAKAKPDRSKALKELAKATAKHPGFAEAWHLTGEIQLEQGHASAARASFEKARAAEPGLVKPYLSLARLALFEEKWEEALLVTGSALELEPASPQANYFNGLANFFLGRAEAAERSLRFLKDGGYGRQFPIALLHLGLIHARKGRFVEAAGELSFYLTHMPPDQMPPGQKEQLENQLAAWARQGYLPAQGAEIP